jgi:hypothetical protein
MVRRQQAADRAVRPKLRSPGHPKFQRQAQEGFAQLEVALPSLLNRSTG